jgi:hypothetical protein
LIYRLHWHDEHQQLSAIANGTGGFVINGENVDDISGNSVSTAGDIQTPLCHWQ